MNEENHPFLSHHAVKTERIHKNDRNIYAEKLFEKKKKSVFENDSSNMKFDFNIRSNSFEKSISLEPF